MTRTQLVGASYVDAWPDGEYVALYASSHLQTHLGRIELPEDQQFGLLFLRCSPYGGFHFGGMQHHSVGGPQFREWSFGAWRDPVPTATGYVVYDRDNGDAHDTLPAGYQFVDDDGKLIDRIWAYPPRDGIPLSNWTETAGIRIGQGNPGGGVRVFADGVLRELEPGDCRFINVNRSLARVTISFWKIGVGAVIWQTTLEELRALPPIEQSPMPNPPPVPVPVPVPPKEPPVSVPSQLDLVKSIRAKYPRSAPGSSPLGEDAWIAIVEVAQRTGTLVFRKDGGERTFIPPGLLPKYPNGVSINRTIIGRGAFGNRWVKVFGDGEGTAFPIWTVGDTPADGEYVDVSGIRLPGQTPPPPPPPPPTDPDVAWALVRAALSDLRTAEAALERALETRR